MTDDHTLKYEQPILDSFKKLGKNPRGHQLADIHYIIEAYLDRGKSKVILSAPTGSGKSIIGAVVADVLHTLQGEVGEEGSFILMGTNILATQYAETFDGVRDFLQVKGSGNYQCNALSTFIEPVFADSCCEGDMRRSKEADLAQIVSKYCGKCEFAYIKKAKHKARHLITNYSYFFVDRLYTFQHAHRTITVWDEAHTVNDAFAEHCAVFVSDKRLTQIAEEIGTNLNITDLGVFTFLKKFKADIASNSIDESNYMTYLQKLLTFYKNVEDIAKTMAKSYLSSDLKLYSKLSKLGKKYGDMACKIGDLMTYNYEHILEVKPKEKELIVKPIFVGEMFQQLVNSKYQLFMSATVSGPLLIDTLGLNPAEVEFIKLPPYFPVDNKKMVFLNIDKFNYLSMKDPKVQTKIVNACVKLSNRHIDEGESGIILTPSFDVTEMVSDKLRKDVKLFQHERGTKLAPLVEKFKKCDEPSVLISPSMFEGLSLDDDLSRFQIFIKCPYASLGEKRVKYIADRHPQLYQLQTILRIIQGAGRSVRSEEDYATTYMLDGFLSQIWKSYLNEWKDEFSVSYQTLI